MEKELQNRIAGEIENILSCAPTATELAEWYLRNRPSGSAEASCRDEIRQKLSEFEIIDGKQDLLHEISEAYLHFTAYILYEGGFFANNKIHEMLVSSEQLSSRIEESKNAVELFHIMPVSVNPKAELMVRSQYVCNIQEPIYVKSSQLTDLQMLCLRIPEAVHSIVHTMGQRPCIRAEDANDKPYLRAYIKVLFGLISNSIPMEQSNNGITHAKLITLTAGILNAFYDEYLSFPSDDYLIDLVTNSISES